MELKLIRKYKKNAYTIGALYINNVKFCDTLEDKDRGLTSTMSEIQIKAIKVNDNTAIPSGTYTINMFIKSPKYSNYSKYSWARECNGCVPRLLDVKGYEGVLIHPGNDKDDTSGCILVGENKAVGKVLKSVVTWKALYKKLKEASNKGEKITITIL